MSQEVKGTRDLRKLIPKSHVEWAADVAATTATGGWKILGSGGAQFAVYRTYIDIVGWSKDDITAFTQGAAFQEGGSIYYSGGGALPLKCWDIVSASSR